MSEMAQSVQVNERAVSLSSGPVKVTSSVTAKDSIGRIIIERVLSLIALIMFSPFILLIALAVFFGSGWPIFYKQTRVGLNGKAFQLLKFRSMRTGNSGPSITAGGDSRITRAGKILRKFKLDELPQLWNVVRGDMSLVGPRPEVSQFVDMGDPIWRSVLSVRPGITDPASIAFRNEEAILAKAADPIAFYRSSVLPAKLVMNLEYIAKRNVWSDARIVLQTANCAIFPKGKTSKEIGL
jgi:lipopolysaccharide/colanic/teichoic acid biosynthesis glycosyltransferase